jgi:predicted unusual protein kinase regulating ubiquinone biosynthesis (AarF/ABC1/UbiB family)
LPSSLVQEGIPVTGDPEFDLFKDCWLYLSFLTFFYAVPAYFALITRAMIVLEGIAVTGDPEFDLFRAAYPYRYRGSYYY